MSERPETPFSVVLGVIGRHRLNLDLAAHRYELAALVVARLTESGMLPPSVDRMADARTLDETSALVGDDDA